jgi:predicted phosphoadenosine phosphosulfate sulfurtransferase
MGKIHRKVPVDSSCYELTLERLTYVFERFDQVAVSFSGGKDSTVCLNLALQVARATGRLPLDVISFDEEAIPPDTVEYMARVATLPDIQFRWYCVPIQHRNACSTTEPYWFPWAPEDEHRWVRPLPPLAITAYPGFTRTGIAEQMPALFPASRGTAAIIMGIRTQESMSRHRAIASKVGRLAFMTPAGAARHITNVYPVYDWATEDVWIAPARLGWDYNRAYDVMDAAGMPRHAQRCAPPFGEQPIRGLHTFKTCWPQLWGKMVDRVAGAATAARYANTELYANAVSDEDLPHGLTWREYTLSTLRALTPASRQEAAAAINACIIGHKRRTGGRPIPDDVPDPLSGFCWKTLYIAAKVGGDKFGRQMQKMGNIALAERRRRGARCIRSTASSGSRRRPWRRTTTTRTSSRRRNSGC